MNDALMKSSLMLHAEVSRNNNCCTQLHTLLNYSKYCVHVSVPDSVVGCAYMYI